MAQGTATEVSPRGAVGRLFSLGMPPSTAGAKVAESESAGKRGVYIPWKGGHVTIVAVPLRADRMSYVISWNYPE